ncbi:MAG: hypothetical protein JWQ35_1904 [Bacteriovoracaceae bacterium]|nr:hypothetical protein [Bacteriovoracaceae bacterium]
MSKNYFLDRASILTLTLTIGLFIVALFEKGFTHDLLVEAGVFLISMKLVIAAHKTDSSHRAIQEKLDLILSKTKDKQ